MIKNGEIMMSKVKINNKAKMKPCYDKA